MKGRAIRYSADELVFLQQHSQLERAELHRLFAQQFGREDISVDNIKRLCFRKGWGTGRTGHFAKGGTPVNKGKTMPYHPNSAATRFKPGQAAHNYHGHGHERIDRKDGYVIMIVDEVNPWNGHKTRPVHKHRWLWEQANGPVPEGHCLKYLDGDKTNCDLANWELIPRALLPRLNGIHGRGYDAAPAELKPTIMAVTKLEYGMRETRRAK